ncbi:hypothetical protein [Anabaena azotica]|uniref:Uncharacterized protein n=1 Tax=Anabaena azotica FACHB-119 TaxID=947527 RepID=A0ABR8D9N5_9NOST|nr:hypothetical protein [Anabaena azotica]MBD2503143.1 hypothetical protein [Anabaena azotica FACHB-119]
MNREEHLAWAKSRALYYLNEGNIDMAVISFTSDMRKHGELKRHPGIELLTMAHLGSNLNIKFARKLINDCN